MAAGHRDHTSYVITSADRLTHIANASVDYVFTDPPFGSNIFYSDKISSTRRGSGNVTDHTREAVMHTTGKKRSGAAERYEALLRSAFFEAFRILRPGRYMSIVFGNSDGRIWDLVPPGRSATLASKPCRSMWRSSTKGSARLRG